jgi:hypothetical protein
MARIALLTQWVARLLDDRSAFRDERAAGLQI